ncbi:DUF4837 family protein [Parabacteroides sp. 52]|uniref:DUF4837 family protein n=1 Tax=unclassified Parabacteroides TaxID=2649774 RepID=UPI0013D7535C|nr:MULTISPECIES: DUF4837 family protein [unclassified Parabacteroides]MDH6533980.1 hypothetical protein [Parabacteroides sp. PM5-20]NDV54721.1 DUF4837 family protein [Parabacteroides sp. 52]
MKTPLFFISMLSLLFLGACTSSPLTKRATGLAYEVVVTMDPAVWNGVAGKTIKNDLTSDIPGLPQSEPAMRLTYASPDNFNGLLTYVRNIVILNIDPKMYTKVSVYSEKDKWAQGQMVVTINAPSQEDVVEYEKTHERAFVNFFTKVEMKRAADLLEGSYETTVMEKVQRKFNVSLKVPVDMTYSRDEKGFFWASNNASTGRTDIVVYSFPYTDENTFTRDYLIAKRDSVMKVNMPGSFPDSYMTTETRYVMPTYTPITMNGQYCGVLRGLWRMQGDMMGGPFVSYTRLDEINNKVIVAEAFVYAPETNKRNFIRRIEAALNTLRLPGEENILDEVIVLPASLDEKK